MLLSRQFLLIYLMNTMSIITGYFTVNNYKAYAGTNGIKDESYLALVGSIASFCSAIRFVWSMGTDHFTYRLVYGVMLVLQAILNFTIPLVNESRGAYAVWIAGILFCEGAHFVLVPNILKKLFGKYGITCYGFAITYTSVGNLLIVLLQGPLLDDSESSYNTFFYVNGALSVLALAILLLIFKEKKFIE